MVSAADRVRAQRRQPDADRSAAGNGHDRQHHHGAGQRHSDSASAERRQHDGDGVVQRHYAGHEKRRVRSEFHGRIGKSAGRSVRKHGDDERGGSEPDQQRAIASDDSSSDERAAARAVRFERKFPRRIVFEQSGVGVAGCSAAERVADDRDRPDDVRIGGGVLRAGDRDHGSERESGGGDDVRMQPGADGQQERGGGREGDSQGIVANADLRERRVIDAAGGKYTRVAAAVAAGREQQHGGARRRVAGVRVQRRVGRFFGTGADGERRIDDPVVVAEHGRDTEPADGGISGRVQRVSARQSVAGGCR